MRDQRRFFEATCSARRSAGRSRAVAIRPQPQAPAAANKLLGDITKAQRARAAAMGWRKYHAEMKRDA